MILENIKQQQANFISKIFACDTVCGDHIKTDFFEHIKKSSLPDLEYVLGPLGINLKSFIEVIDEQHPELANIFYGQFISENEGTLGRQIVDLLKIYAFVKNEKLSNKHIDILKISLFELHKDQVCKKINSPILNQSYIRLVKCKEIRSFIRLKKKHQFFSIGNYPYQIWNHAPLDLSFVSRHQNVFEGEIEKIQKRRLLFIEHGLNFMAAQTEEEITHLSTSANQKQFLGFNEIPIKFLALVLAKMNGFEQIEVSNNVNKYVLRKEKLPSNVLAKDLSDLEIQCTLYNYSIFFPNLIPQNIKDLVAHLDAFPELDNKPMFDRFRIVLTTLKLPQKGTSVYDIINKDGGIDRCFDHSQAQHALNYRLVETSQTIGALLGERDGIHYFITYFI